MTISLVKSSFQTRLFGCKTSYMSYNVEIAIHGLIIYEIVMQRLILVGCFIHCTKIGHAGYHLKYLFIFYTKKQ